MSRQTPTIEELETRLAIALGRPTAALRGPATATRDLAALGDVVFAVLARLRTLEDQLIALELQALSRGDR